MQIQERNIHDPVPRNVSKFPIHQTYLSSDAEGNNNGIYKFKCPEVWSSARSGKKAIAIRSIKWQSSAIVLDFAINFTDTGGTNRSIIYRNTIPAHMCVTDVLVDIRTKFQEIVHDLSLDTYYLITNLEGSKNELTIKLMNTDTAVNFRISNSANAANCSESFNIWLNQPKDYFPAAANELTYNNVWDRTSALNFHASFIPFDNYQYLGAIFDNWNKPIIYQDASASPLFNVWITTDMKHPINLLHEQFIFRFTFIISSDQQYST